MEKFERNNDRLEERMRQIKARIAEIESMNPLQANDENLLEELRELRQELVKITVYLTNR